MADIGAGAVDRGGAFNPNFTCISKENPASQAGKVVTVNLWANTNLEGCNVGTVYLVSGTTFKCRDIAAIGTVTAGAKRTFTGLSIDVEIGDYIAIFWAVGLLDRDTTGEGIWYVADDQLVADNEAIYTLLADRTLSLGGEIGDNPPTITIQSVTNIVTTTATGNGNVTSLGDASVTQHGHCWNTTGTPTTADSKTENGAKATIGAFTSAITGLTAGTKYYVRAYAINDLGTSYSNEMVFWADKGTVYPTDPLLRASGIRRTFWSGLGGQAVYQCELALGGMTTSYVSPIGSRDIPSAVTPTEAPEVGSQQADYQVWLNYYITYNLPGLIKTFGHIPTYEEWVAWKQSPTLP